jgi:hypothetical protein
VYTSGEFLGDLPQGLVPEELDCAVDCSRGHRRMRARRR